MTRAAVARFAVKPWLAFMRVIFSLMVWASQWFASEIAPEAVRELALGLLIGYP